MLDDAVVRLAQALNGDIDPTYSVNALLPVVRRRAGDPEPPPIAAVYDQVRTPAIIRGDEPDAVPALVVTASADLSLYTLGGERTPASIGVAHPQPGLAGSPLILSVSYVIRLTDAVPAAPNTGYSLTAIRRSIGRFMQADVASRTLSDTLLIGTTQVTERRLLASKGNSALMGVVLAVCLVEDLAP